jgi:hypothetical protein
LILGTIELNCSKSTAKRGRRISKVDFSGVSN